MCKWKCKQSYYDKDGKLVINCRLNMIYGGDASLACDDACYFVTDGDFEYYSNRYPELFKKEDNGSNK